MVFKLIFLKVMLQVFFQMRSYLKSHMKQIMVELLWEKWAWGLEPYSIGLLLSDLAAAKEALWSLGV